MKKKKAVMGKCRYTACGKEYNVTETKRVFGDCFWTELYCSAQCYTNATMDKEEDKKTENQEITDKLKRMYLLYLEKYEDASMYRVGDKILLYSGSLLVLEHLLIEYGQSEFTNKMRTQLDGRRNIVMKAFHQLGHKIGE